MMPDIPKIDPRIIDGFLEFSTPTISDALDGMEIRCGCEGIKPILPGKKICGQAFTVHYVPRGKNPATTGDFLDDVPPGFVLVIDNAGRTDCTVWGDLMTKLAVRNGIAGTVIDGVCRDVAGIREMDYPIFTRGFNFVTGKDRVQLEYVNRPVNMGKILVRPGDIVFADDNGVLVIPYEHVSEALNRARRIAEAEERITEEINRGTSLTEARARVRYHDLQKPDDPS